MYSVIFINNVYPVHIKQIIALGRNLYPEMFTSYDDVHYKRETKLYSFSYVTGTWDEIYSTLLDSLDKLAPVWDFCNKYELPLMIDIGIFTDEYYNTDHCYSICSLPINTPLIDKLVTYNIALAFSYYNRMRLIPYEEFNDPSYPNEDIFKIFPYFRKLKQ